MKKLSYFLLFGVLFSVFITSTIAHDENESILIHMYEDRYEPEDISIPQGIKVIFESVDGGHWPASNIHPTHRAYPGSDIAKCETDEEKNIFDACRTLEAGENYEFVFNEPGEWRYHDHNDPKLKGKIIVKGEVDFDNKESPTVFTNLKNSYKNFFLRIKELIFGKTIEVPEGVTYIEDIKEDDLVSYSDKDVLYSYTRKFGAEKTIKRLHSLESKYGNCHQAAHDIGNYAYLLEDTNAFKTCSAECHSGCYHGATENFFREHGTENLNEDLSIICNSELNQFFSHQCVHGIGHGLMAWSDYDIFEALENCDKLPDLQGSCHSGVFMENIVGGLADEEGHFTEYLNENPHYPCNILPEKYVPSCYFYQTSRMAQIFFGDFAKIAQTCSEAPYNSQVSCFQSMGRDAGAYSRGNPKQAIEYCKNVPLGENRVNCIVGAVQDFFWDPSGQDIAIEFCSSLSNDAEKNGCYLTIFGRATQIIFSESEFEAFCSKAEINYQRRCLNFLYNSA